MMSTEPRRAESPDISAINRVPDPEISERFLDFVAGDSFPCVGAKSALSRSSIETHEFETLGDPNNDQPMLDGLSRFVSMIDACEPDSNIVHSYVALFSGPFDMDEFGFEHSMWSQLWRLHKLDLLAGNRPAGDVSNDTNSDQFSLSIAEHPFFLIGLHPHASRLARRFSHPALVFNSHRQFEKLRADGRYGKMQTATRARDIQLQGSINPNLADFGVATEARQYSGREVGPEWTCPYEFRTRH